LWLHIKNLWRRLDEDQATSTHQLGLGLGEVVELTDEWSHRGWGYVGSPSKRTTTVDDERKARIHRQRRRSREFALDREGVRQRGRGAVEGSEQMSARVGGGGGGRGIFYLEHRVDKRAYSLNRSCSSSARRATTQAQAWPGCHARPTQARQEACRVSAGLNSCRASGSPLSSTDLNMYSCKNIE
jgi:hypothetical protein